jgi:hypothetical protein
VLKNLVYAQKADAAEMENALVKVIVVLMVYASVHLENVEKSAIARPNDH